MLTWTGCPKRRVIKARSVSNWAESVLACVTGCRGSVAVACAGAEAAKGEQQAGHKLRRQAPEPGNSPKL